MPGQHNPVWGLIHRLCLVKNCTIHVLRCAQEVACITSLHHRWKVAYGADAWTVKDTLIKCCISRCKPMTSKHNNNEKKKQAHHLTDAVKGALQVSSSPHQDGCTHFILRTSHESL